MAAAFLLLLASLALKQCGSLKFFGDAEINVEGADKWSRPNQGNLKYLWPSGRGQVGRYTVSDSQAPVNLTEALSWEWHTKGYISSPIGTVLDDRQNIYLTSLDGIRKFNHWGKQLWEYKTGREIGDELPRMASLYNGAVYFSTANGHIHAISMEAGRKLWSTKVNSTVRNGGWVSVFDGVLVMSSDGEGKTSGDSWNVKKAAREVIGLSVATGNVLWRFEPKAPISNFMGSFAGDGTFVFQDCEGRAYRCRASDGKLIWKNGGLVGTWTDGSALLGPNGVVYAVNSHQFESADPNTPGDVCAYRFEDGQFLWKTAVPRPPHNMPAIGRLARHSGLSVVQPIGQPGAESPADVYALDAETGNVQWIFNSPSQPAKKSIIKSVVAQAKRALNDLWDTAKISSWSSPSIDGLGTVYIGSRDGQIFSLRDVDGDGKLAGEQEVSTYDVKAAFCGSSTPAIGQDMIAMASTDALYVFKR